MSESLFSRLNHISVAVHSIDDALRFYRDMLGLEASPIEHLADRELKVAFVKIGETEIELLEPTSEDNTVSRFLERRGPGLHHICLETDDIETTMAELSERGAEFVDPEPKPGVVGMVAFMLPETARGVLVEINEPFRAETRSGA
jgi:methylmalonyl-CoA/ethylmalonyl-CoA epimerase